MPGYGRVKRGRGYCYTDQAGNRVTDDRKLERFRALVIPPAWKHVWISPSKRGHLQATGVDEDGRKQYMYHPQWTRERQWKKLERMVAFAEALPTIRRRTAQDLKRDKPDKEKVSALALKVTEETLMRIGSERYLRKYGSRGLTTLKKHHISILGNRTVFRFRGKKGVQQAITVNRAGLAADLRELIQLPGPYLFQYIDETGKRFRLSAAEVNGYIHRHAPQGFTSKDYRTWFAGLWAFRLFARLGGYADVGECKTHVLSVLDAVSQRLGNTRSVCKQYYVPDVLVSAYEDGSLLPYLRKSLTAQGNPAVRETEKQLLVFLRQTLASRG